MTRWQVLFLIMAAGFLAVMLFFLGGISTSPNPKNITILLTGDVMLGRSVMTTSLKKGDPLYPFRKVADTLKKADLVFINLENPIIENCPQSDSGFKFCADPKMVEGLTYAGVDVANIANNHSGNYGQDGILQTEKFLKESGIDYVGAGNLVIREVAGIKFGFLGFDYVDAVPSNRDYDLVKESKKKVDILIVAVHWGVEYTKEPTNGEERIAGDLIASGADVIAGTHPHWVQTTSHISDKPVYYSLGNFVFDQAWSEETKRGLVMQLTYQGEKLLNEARLPIYIRAFAQPEFTN